MPSTQRGTSFDRMRIKYPPHITYSVTLSEQISFQNTVSIPDPSFINQYLTTITTIETTTTQTLVTQTLTGAVMTVSQTTSSQSGLDAVISWLNENPIVKLIVTLFGGVVVFAIAIIIGLNSVRRKRVKKDIKELLHMDSPQPDKPEDKKNQ